jgi:hypothetical protein
MKVLMLNYEFPPIGGGVLAISALARGAANRCRRRQHTSRGGDSGARQAEDRSGGGWKIGEAEIWK